MNRLAVFTTFASLVLLAVVVGLTTLPKTKQPNSLQVVQTAYMTVHPAANKGDTVVFQAVAPSGGTTYVHFPLQSPCAQKDLPSSAGQPPQCTVTADVVAVPFAQYPYAVDSNPTLVATQGRCSSCCFMCQIVVRNPKPDQLQIQSAVVGSGPYPAVEILIDESTNPAATLFAKNTQAYPGQPVKWYRSGTDNNTWSVTFANPAACTAPKPIGSGAALQSPVCTFAGNATGSPYQYTMSAVGVNGAVMTGTGLLYAAQPVPPN